MNVPYERINVTKLFLLTPGCKKARPSAQRLLWFFIVFMYILNVLGFFE